MTINIIAMFAHLALVFWTLKRVRVYMVLLGYVMFVQTWSLASCLYNDFGIYNFELFRYTETTLATSRLALFYIVFNLGFLVVASILAKRPLSRREYTLGIEGLRLGNLKLTAYFFGMVVLGYVAYSFATDGIPIFEGVHKVLFYQDAGPVERFLLGYGPFIAFALGYFRRLRGRISISGILLVLMLLYLVLTGNKFSALTRLAVCYYAAVFAQYWQTNPNFKILRLRNIVIGLAVIMLIIGGVLASYSFWGLSAQDARLLLFDRVLALQGHLWWASDHSLFALDRFDPNHWLAEWRAIVNLGQVAEGTAGMKYVMVQAIGAERAFPIFFNGYLYTMAYPAILVLTFPYPVALGLQFLAGVFLCGLLYYLHHCLVYRHFVRAMLAMTIIIPFIGVLSTGDLFVLVTPGIALKLLILLVLELGVIRYSLGPSRLTPAESRGSVVDGAMD